MFISKLNNIIETYDKYGEHRINGLKAVYLLLILFLINFIYGIPNPYFYYFYIPMTAFGAEVVAENAKAKYLQFFYTMIGAIISIFLFNITVIYPVIFLFFVFFYCLFLYLIALHKIKNLFIPVPLIISLSIYSLVYGQVNTDLYIAFNNALITLAAVVIVMTAMLFFPLSYYFRAWIRAFILLLKQIKGNFEFLRDFQDIKIELVQPHLVMLFRYTHLLPRKLPTFNILKMSIQTNELRVMSCVKENLLLRSDIDNVINGLSRLIYAVENYKICKNEEYYPLVLHKIINNWNYLCCKI